MIECMYVILFTKYLHKHCYTCSLINTYSLKIIIMKTNLFFSKMA